MLILIAYAVGAWLTFCVAEVILSSTIPAWRAAREAAKEI